MRSPLFILGLSMPPVPASVFGTGSVTVRAPQTAIVVTAVAAATQVRP